MRRKLDTGRGAPQRPPPRLFRRRRSARSHAGPAGSDAVGSPRKCATPADPQAGDDRRHSWVDARRRSGDCAALRPGPGGRRHGIRLPGNQARRLPAGGGRLPCGDLRRPAGDAVVAGRVHHRCYRVDLRPGVPGRAGGGALGDGRPRDGRPGRPQWGGASRPHQRDAGTASARAAATARCRDRDVSGDRRPLARCQGRDRRLPGKTSARLEPPLTGKQRSLAVAIAEQVHDGDAVALGLALESGIPFAAVHEIIRQRRKDLTLIGPISDMAFDQLIAAGVVAKVIAAWVGNVAGGSGYGFRRAYEQGQPRRIVMEDHSNFTVGLALKAAAMGLPYLPTFTGFGGDIVRGHPRIRPIEDPFGGPGLLAVGAIKPDVAIVHVQRADASGNAHLWGNLGLTVEAAYAARRTIVVCEEIVPDDVIRSDPNRTVIPGFLVSAVVEEPGGALPSSVQGYWRRDFETFLRYHGLSKTPDGYQSWLEEWVLELPDRPAYLRHMGDAAVERLRVSDRRLAAETNFAP